MTRRSFPRWTCGIGLTFLVTAGAMVVEGPAVSARQADPAVTFTRDVAPILQQHCQVCHQPESIAPMSLLTYEEAVTFAPLIKDRVAARIMRPCHSSRRVSAC